MKREMSPCGGSCITCPFAFTEESEQVQNYGCLPEPMEIVSMKEKSGHNWSCHYDDNILCGGFANWVKKYRPDLNVKEGKLISYEVWYSEGQEEAIRKAR